MSHDLSNCSWCTRVIHENQHKDQFGAVVQPIYQTSTFRFDNCDIGGARFAGIDRGYKYTRLGNPSNANLEGKIAALENAEAGVTAASGMGAIAATVLTILKAGDHLISDNTLYGCTVDLFENELRKFGVEVDFIDCAIPGNIKSHLKPNTKIVYFETPANPTLKIIDIERAAQEAHSQPGVYVIADNTFSTPIITRPIDFGVDIVVQSVTKFINGHTDVVGGIVCGKQDMMRKIMDQGIKDITGSVMSAHDAWLVVRGLQTLDLRLNRCCENAQKVAEFLVQQPQVSKVYYPGLPQHPGYEIAKKQMKLFGAMISFELKGGFEAGKKLLNNLHLLTLAVSLGGCESLIQHPASMTHAGVPKEEREAAGLTDNLIRLSVGIEGIDDILADLKQGLALL